jgi:F0F1-type ATP synthase assembly protein I
MKQDFRGLGVYGTVGLEFGLSVLLGLWAGQWLDRRFALYPWLTLVGIGFGTAAGIRSLIRTMRRATKELEQEDLALREARRKYHEQHKRK